MRSLSRSMLMTLLCFALATLCVLYLDTARSIVAIWNSSETFAHGYIILPISLWLIWKQRDALRHAAPAPFWAALALLIVCGAGWLLAELADVQVVRQYAFVAMLPIAVLAICGYRMAALISFPLAFLLLAVPFGEIFIAPLINVTADFTVWALHQTGVPVLRDGTNFSIPSGNWSVVEACSGVRYLISSFTLGCLYAYLTYRSTGRRLLFVGLSIVVPILANGARAYMIVMIGHLSGNTLAVGVDHLIYGWVFFALVIFLMFWIGSYWREDGPQPVRAPQPQPQPQPQRSASAPGAARFAVAALAVMMCAGIWPSLADHLARTASGKPAADLSSLQPAWAPAAEFAQWRPYFTKASAEVTRAVSNGSDHAAITLLYYRDRPQGAGLINSENRLLKAKDPQWTAGLTAKRDVTLGPRTLRVRETTLRGTGGAILVWQWYWINDQFLENDYLGKILQARGKLLLGSDDGAALFAWAPLDEKPEAARAVLTRFLNDNLPAIEATLTGNLRQAVR